VLSDRHLRALQEFRHLLALAQLHVGLLPVRPAAGVAPLPLDLAVRDAGPDALDFRSEQLLDGALDLGLVRAGRDVKHDGAAVLALDRRLLGDQRPAGGIFGLHLSPEVADCRLLIDCRLEQMSICNLQSEICNYLSASCNFSRALLVITTLPAS